jgi:DNA-binding response OmpR family regulator
MRKSRNRVSGIMELTANMVSASLKWAATDFGAKYDGYTFNAYPISINGRNRKSREQEQAHRRESALLRRYLVQTPAAARLVRSAVRGERMLDLLPTEFKLLEYLMRHAGQTVTRTMVLEDVWHYGFLKQTNLVDVHIGKLRRKVDMAGELPLIRSVRRAGFMLHAGD